MPRPSTATGPISPKVALVAGPPSPAVAPAVRIVSCPFPATAITLSVPGATSRIRAPATATARILPSGPRPRLIGWEGVPSPLKAGIWWTRKTVEMRPVAAETSRIESQAVTMKMSEAASTVMPSGGQIAARVAGPPSPEVPSRPVPATSVMRPVAAETLRTSKLAVSAM